MDLEFEDATRATSLFPDVCYHAALRIWLMFNYPARVKGIMSSFVQSPKGQAFVCFVVVVVVVVVYFFCFFGLPGLNFSHI